MRCPHCKNDNPRLLERLTHDTARCDVCSKEFNAPVRKLTVHERHELAADHGFDTWEDYRGER